MGLFVANILLAVVWVLSFGPFNPGNFAVGLVLGYVFLRTASTRGRRSAYFAKVWQCLSFTVYFLWELIKANLTMARYTLSPLGKLRPGILAVPLEPGMTDLEITTLANVITLTPGTLSMDVSGDRGTLFVHCMNVPDREAAIGEMREGFMRRILALTRDMEPHPQPILVGSAAEADDHRGPRRDAEND